MRFLFIGDIVGRAAREALGAHISGLKERLALDFVVVNAENAAGGAGITPEIVQTLLAMGVDGITLGDHAWDKKAFVERVGELKGVCRPFNLLEGSPGVGLLRLVSAAGTLGVATVLGREFMRMPVTCPFRAAQAAVEELRDCDAVLIEVHAEATSEKVALGWLLDGKAAAVLGTHTHIPTADARVLPGGSAYCTDVGMSGPYESVLGREIAPVLGRFLDGVPRPWPVAKGHLRLCGMLLECEEGLANCIEPVVVDGVSGELLKGI